MESIKEIIEYFLDNPLPDSDYRRITFETAMNMARIVLGDQDNFILFDNAGGNLFSIWRGEVAKEIVNSFTDCDDLFVRTYAFRVDGEDVVLKIPWSAKN